MLHVFAQCAGRAVDDSSVDFVELSLWAQGSGLDTAYAASHRVFRPDLSSAKTRREHSAGGWGDDADGDEEHGVQAVLMNAEEERDVAQLLEGSTARSPKPRPGSYNAHS